MKVIGLTGPLAAEAKREFQGGFSAWLDQLRRGSWRNWAELLRYYPSARRTTENVAHFPLAEDGAGIEAAVSFPANPTHLSIIRLLRVCPAIAAAVTPARAAGRKISKPLVG